MADLLNSYFDSVFTKEEEDGGAAPERTQAVRVRVGMSLQGDKDASAEWLGVGRISPVLAGWGERMDFSEQLFPAGSWVTRGLHYNTHFCSPNWLPLRGDQRGGHRADTSFSLLLWERGGQR